MGRLQDGLNDALKELVEHGQCQTTYYVAQRLPKPFMGTFELTSLSIKPNTAMTPYRVKWVGFVEPLTDEELDKFIDAVGSANVPTNSYIYIRALNNIYARKDWFEWKMQINKLIKALNLWRAYSGQ